MAMTVSPDVTSQERLYLKQIAFSDTKFYRASRLGVDVLRKLYNMVLKSTNFCMGEPEIHRFCLLKQGVLNPDLDGKIMVGSTTGFP